MKKLMLTIFILSIADSILTFIGIRSNIIVETVPVIRDYYNSNPLASVIVDIAATTALFAIIWALRKNRRWIIYPLAAILPIKLYAIFVHVSWIIQI